MRPGKMSVPSVLIGALLLVVALLYHRNGYPRADTQFIENRKIDQGTTHTHDIYESSTHEFLIVIRRTQEFNF